ncbi:MAG TPA: hypothetical protein VF546_01785 [Pyrinomonadaceae bacterium]
MRGRRLGASTCVLVVAAAFSCALAQERPGGGAARKLDELQPRYLEDFELRVIHFADEVLKVEPNAQAYVIGYDGRHRRLRDTVFNLDRVRNHLVEARGLPGARVVTIEGGTREQPALEFWLVPAGATPPAATPTVQAQRPLSVSLVQLIADPARYHGRLVRVVGFVSIRFEGKAVYLHEDDYRQRIAKNGLWLDLPGTKSGGEYAQYHERYALVEGVFDATLKGHGGAFSGALRRVRRMQVNEE